MESLLIVMKLLGVACVCAGASLVVARVLRVERVFEFLSRADLKPWRLSLAVVAVSLLGGAALITTGLVPADFSRLWVGLGLWFMIAAPMLAWPILTVGREPMEGATSHRLPEVSREAASSRRAA